MRSLLYSFFALTLVYTNPLRAGPKEDLTEAMTEFFAVPTSVEELVFLRNRPTIAGIAFPKYYLWVTGKKGDEAYLGAIRVADENGDIVVTHFLSAQSILADPSFVTTVFPQALYSAIIERAHNSKN